MFHETDNPSHLPFSGTRHHLVVANPTNQNYTAYCATAWIFTTRYSILSTASKGADSCCIPHQFPPLIPLQSPYIIDNYLTSPPSPLSSCKPPSRAARQSPISFLLGLSMCLPSSFPRQVLDSDRVMRKFRGVSRGRVGVPLPGLPGGCISTQVRLFRISTKLKV